MKTLALLCAAALLVSCASSDGLIDERVLDCSSGQDLMVRVGVQPPTRMGGESTIDNRFIMLVELSNNSHHDVTVDHVRVEQYSRGGSRPPYEFDSGYKKVDQLLEEGKDITVEIPVDGRWTRTLDPQYQDPGRVEMLVSVALANGDAYRCVFVAGN
jgi:hypothetical protein